MKQVDLSVNVPAPDYGAGSVVLNDCQVCSGRRFFIEPDREELRMLMGCYRCGNQVDVPIIEMQGFSLSRWKNPFERGRLYSLLVPLYEFWNSSNLPFDWRGMDGSAGS